MSRDLLAFPGLSLEAVRTGTISRDPLLMPMVGDIFGGSRRTREITELWAGEPKAGAAWQPGHSLGLPGSVSYQTRSGSRSQTTWREWARWARDVRWLHDAAWCGYGEALREARRMRRRGAHFILSWNEETGTGTWVWGEVRLREEQPAPGKLCLEYVYRVPGKSPYMEWTTAPKRGDRAGVRLAEWPCDGWNPVSVSNFALGVIHANQRLRGLSLATMARMLKAADADLLGPEPTGPKNLHWQQQPRADMGRLFGSGGEG